MTCQNNEQCKKIDRGADGTARKTLMHRDDHTHKKLEKYIAFYKMKIT